MKLNQELQEILDGKKGETLKKVLRTMMRYGELFGADAMVPVTSRYNHLVTSFGLKALTPVYGLLDQPGGSRIKTEIFYGSQAFGS